MGVEASSTVNMTGRITIKSLLTNSHQILLGRKTMTLNESVASVWMHMTLVGQSEPSCTAYCWHI